MAAGGVGVGSWRQLHRGPDDVHGEPATLRTATTRRVGQPAGRRRAWPPQAPRQLPHVRLSPSAARARPRFAASLCLCCPQRGSGARTEAVPADVVYGGGGGDGCGGGSQSGVPARSAAVLDGGLDSPAGNPTHDGLREPGERAHGCSGEDQWWRWETLDASDAPVLAGHADDVRGLGAGRRLVPGGLRCALPARALCLAGG
eukprot:189451-Rhodomonas_salina.3